MPLSPANVQVLRWFASYSRLCSALIVAAAAIWLAAPELDDVVPSGAFPQKGRLHLGTALALGVSGFALLCVQSANKQLRTVALALSLIVTGIGLARLLGINLAWIAGDDLTILGNTAGGMTRIDIVALALCAVGALGALVASRQLPAVKETIAIALLAMSIAGIASYAFMVGGKPGNLFSDIAIHKSVFLLALTSGWMAADPRTGLLRITTLDSYGGELARRLMVPSLLLPVAFTFAFKHVERYFGISESLALTLGATMTGGAIAAMVWGAAVAVDRGERHRAEAATLRHAATRDGLTGLFNRRYFDDALKALFQGARARPAEISLVLLDVDHFKAFNDSFGHPAGDDVLRLIGTTVRDSLRPADIPARYGGEEFVIILPDTDLLAAGKVADRICREIRGQEWPLRAVTVSIGLAIAGKDETPESLLSRADRALYRAKELGRDLVCSEEAAASCDSRAS